MRVTLGISFSSRNIGLAVFRDGKLAHWAIKMFTDKWSDEKLKDIILAIYTFAKKNKVTEVAIKLPDEIPISKSYTQLIGALNICIDGMGLPIHYFHLSELKSYYCPKGKANKKNLAECLAIQHPHLVPAYLKEKPKKISYYIWAFEAVAAAGRLLQINSD